ncbi:MAG: DNA cytosine methyltransferase [Nitrospirae bacterium]|nr:DNA cytosine methyltransferase [Nitrospirota bacterium]
MKKISRPTRTGKSNLVIAAASGKASLVANLKHSFFNTRTDVRPARERLDQRLTVIDLFCGCGGFSLGMLRAGYDVIAGVDFDSDALATYKENLPDVPYAVHADLTVLRPEKLKELTGVTRVDVIVGGPPCQGYSTARMRDGANHGNRRLVPDKRRQLYKYFLKHVEGFQPKMFIMENVLGIRSAADGEYFTRVQNESRRLGYRVHSQVEEAWELGVPQKRRRQLFIGVHKSIPGFLLPKFFPPKRAIPRPLLGVAIDDLPFLKADTGQNERGYELVRRERYIQKYGEQGSTYLFDVLEVQKADKLRNHVARPHNDRDLRDFARLKEGETSAVAMRERGVEFEFPYDKTVFKDRYTRQSRKKPCSTIVAHLSKDGLMFIHPTQNRSLTPREAARVQSFPDWFRFPPARTVAYSLIGNAVPPLVAEAVGNAVKMFLDRKDQHSGSDIFRKATKVPYPACSANLSSQSEMGLECRYLPKTPSGGAEYLERLIGLGGRYLRKLSTEDFARGWHALLYLFPDLHPNTALDHGRSVHLVCMKRDGLERIDRITARRYTRSGWPLALTAIGQEAWRRYRSGEMHEDVFYCQIAHHAGWQLYILSAAGKGNAAFAI